MSYRVIISKEASKELKQLSAPVTKRIFVKIKSLAINPRPNGCKKLLGKKEELWRIRIGEYRVLYTIEDEIKIVDIRRVGHRKNIYR